MKKVIFIGGTAYSGSTMLDMILANDPHGFSCGEVRYFYFPHTAQQAQISCGCHNPKCEIWHKLKQRGHKYLYEAIFEMLPDTQFIVDSSKDPFWIQEQTKRLSTLGIESKHVLIWKTPMDSAASFRRRSEFDIWKKSWINYHKLYFTLIPEWQSINYRDFVLDKTVRQRTCAYLGIPYFDGKEQYWQKTHHILFGNTRTLSHLATTNMQAEDCSTDLSSASGQNGQEHQTIYYRPVTDPELQEVIQHHLHIDSTFDAIIRNLEALNISNPITQPHLSMETLSKAAVAARRIKRKTRIQLAKYWLHRQPYNARK